MSLIDEALKRAQAAHQKEGLPEEGPRPEAPAPLPDRRHTARARALTAAVASIIAAALAVAGALLLRHTRSGALPTATAVKAPAPVSGLPPITSEVTVAAPLRGLVPGAVRPERAAPAPSTAFEQRASAAPAAASITAPASSLPRPTTEARTQAREQKPRGQADGRTYVGEMSLPGGGKITLDGIVYSEESPVAVVNGKVVAAGGYVEGFTVARILPDRVELEGENSKVFLILR